MSWDVSFTIHCNCDRCNRADDYDLDEPTDTVDAMNYLESEGWVFRNGEVLCDECAEETKGLDEFTDRCMSCWHRVNGHCPQYKESCENVYYHHYSMEDSSSCKFYMQIGGKKDNAPKYKPVEASLDEFIAIGEGVSE